MKKLTLQENFFAVCAAIVLSLVLHQFLPATIVRGISMSPTIQDSSIVLLSPTWLRPAQRGDVVVFRSPEGDKYLIKRLVGMPGETICAVDDCLYIDSVFLEEVPGTGTWGPIEIPEGEVFCMGDNRSFSCDSRFFGTVAMDTLVYKTSHHPAAWIAKSA